MTEDIRETKSLPMTLPYPKRIQRKRTMGWRMQEGAVYVGRPTLFGNPVNVGGKCSAAQATKAYRELLKLPQLKLLDRLTDENGHVIHGFTSLGVIAWREAIKKKLPALRGRDLACWCPLDQPCHADVLLELANK